MSNLTLLDRKRLRRVIAETAATARAVVLIGSFARGAAVRPVSDLDVLVITETSPDPDSETHLVAITPHQFESRVLDGDDFAQWALRYGLPLAGRGWWNATRNRLSGAPWPMADRKFDLAEKRLTVIEDLLAMEDDDASQYELRFAVSLIARGLLLDAGVFPLSRPELPDQLDYIDHTQLAATLRRLGSEAQMTTDDLLEAVRRARYALTAGRRTSDNPLPSYGCEMSSDHRTSPTSA